MAVTGQGPASSTVTRSTRPSSRNRWVIPSFLARMAGMSVEGESDLDVHAGGQMVEPLKRVDGLGRGLMDVDQALVRTDLEVLLGVLVLEGGLHHGVHVLLRGQRHGTRNGRAGPRDPGARPLWSYLTPVARRACAPAVSYLMISVTTPEPTVRPPSRIAKRRPASMAMGWISSTSICTLSPGMTISVPSGRLATPVTSVVRK